MKNVLTLILMIVSLTPSYAQDFKKLEFGMTKSEVIKALDSDNTVYKVGNEYRTSIGGVEMDITFDFNKKNKLAQITCFSTKIHEKLDFATRTLSECKKLNKAVENKYNKSSILTDNIPNTANYLDNNEMYIYSKLYSGSVMVYVGFATTKDYTQATNAILSLGSMIFTRDVEPDF